MNTLQKNFKDLLQLEEAAKEAYLDILKSIKDEEIIRKITFIKNQEISHIEYAKDLIKITKKSQKRKNNLKIPEATPNLIHADFLFKRQLLNVIMQLLNSKIQTFALTALLNKESDKFKKANKSHRELIGIVTHQLKTPLTVTKWISESLLKDQQTLTKEQKSLLKQVKSANVSMFALLNDLLTIDKIHEKKSKDIKIDLVKVLKETLKELDYLIKRKKQKISFSSFKKSILIKSNESAFKKIVYNFLTNAINYGKEKGNISIKIIKKKKDILLSISDDGIGIPKDEQKHVFKKFFRAKNAKEINDEGTGLGLYIAKELADKIKYKIDFQSEENKGTTFNILIPDK